LRGRLSPSSEQPYLKFLHWKTKFHVQYFVKLLNPFLISPENLFPIGKFLCFLLHWNILWKHLTLYFNNTCTQKYC
jgi:hypothetical protein